MPQLLHLMASPRGEASESRQAARQWARSWLQAGADHALRERDLYQPLLPHPDAGFAEASLLTDGLREDRHQSALALSETLIAELDGADALLVSSPLHNFMVPSAFKAWIDLVLRPRRTFSITPQGKTGLLRDRPVRLVLSSGGRLGEGPGGQPDFVTPYLRQVFATLGLRDLQIELLPDRNRRHAAALNARPG
ncbi:MAG: NAD(P)H-dependent oxidoreductase [Curvibacter sp.]|nr:NAD(P)H-dependent oxidoreductase [Curvibacter sp.]